MRILFQLSRKFINLLLFAVLYILLSLIYILILSLILKNQNLENPIMISTLIWWEVDSYISISLPSNILVTTRIVRTMVDIGIISASLSKLTEAINPITMANHFVYDSIDKIVVFRYWIMYPNVRYLYDIQIKVRLTSKRDDHFATNENNGLWYSKENSFKTLTSARGIRYIQLNKDESEELMSKLDRIRHEEDYHIQVMIKGSDSSGKVFSYIKQYTPQQLLYGYKFVPFKEYNCFAFLDENQGRNILKNRARFTTPRYHYFDKVYPMKDSKTPTGLNETELKRYRKSLISKKELKKAFIASDIVEIIIYLFLDSSFSTAIHKIFNL